VCRSCAALATVDDANAKMAAGKRSGRIGSVISVTLGVGILLFCAFVWSRPGALEAAMNSRKFGKVMLMSGPLLGIALVVNGARNWQRSAS